MLLSKTGGSSAVRHSSAPGRFQAGSIPGYTGHVQGRGSEDVHGVSHSRASELASDAVLRRSQRPGHLEGFFPPHPPQGTTHGSTHPDFMTGRIDRGSLNASVGGVDEGGRHVSVRLHTSGGTPPQCRVVSTFHNPVGHGPRAGACVPGYAGHIPGKYAGNVFAKRFAISNLKATEVRQTNHGTNVEAKTNWIVASEEDRRHNSHGAAVVGEQWRHPRTPTSRAGTEGPNAWRLNESVPTHQKVRY